MSGGRRSLSLKVFIERFRPLLTAKSADVSTGLVHPIPICPHERLILGRGHIPDDGKKNTQERRQVGAGESALLKDQPAELAEECHMHREEVIESLP